MLSGYKEERQENKEVAMHCNGGASEKPLRTSCLLLYPVSTLNKQFALEKWRAGMVGIVGEGEYFILGGPSFRDPKLTNCWSYFC